MSDLLPPEDPTEMIFRAALPGRPSRLMAPPDRHRAAVLFAPGRLQLEGAVLLAALAILIPLAAPGAGAFALAARRKGNRRGLAAFLAATWCGLLGIALRRAFGVPLLP
jgi:hypothetical protein